MADSLNILQCEGAQLKTCSRCGIEKPATREFFSPLKSGIFGLHAGCKACMAAWRRRDRAENKARYAQNERSRSVESKQRRAKSARERYFQDRDRAMEKNRARIDRNKEKYNAARREKFANDPVARAKKDAKNAEWREKNIDHVKARARDRWNSASETVRLRSNIGSSISKALKKGGKQGQSWEACVGYTVDVLRAHLERQFQKGMTWDNYGEWHVDHIIPASSFKYESASDPDFRACWCLTNLRPLWATDNIRKRDKRILLI